MYYVLLDEIQLVEGIEFALNGFLYERNIDVYVTGSNSKFLSSDIRRWGKSYMLNYIFYNHLIESGVKENHIIKLALDNYF